MSASKIILISAKQGCGKTSLAEKLVSHYSGFHLKFASTLYEMHDAIYKILAPYGYSPKKGADKRLLQILGTDFARETLGENIWVDILKKKVSAIHGDLRQTHLLGLDKVVVIDDVRFENEYNAFPSAIKIRLECSEEVRKLRAPVWRDNTNHPSEVGLDAYAAQGKFDLYINTEIHNEPETFEMALNFIEGK